MHDAHIDLKNIILGGLLLIAAGVVFGYELVRTSPQPAPIVCTQEAMQCPDGSYVSRTGPNCTFAECAKPSIAQVDMSDWKTYRNEEYGFEVRLPSDWQGYTIESKLIEYGWSITIRHPQWETNKVEIPLEIYTHNQWQEWVSTHFEGYPTAAPIGPTERGHNTRYVFATHPRYNYGFDASPEVTQQVEDILTKLVVF